MCLINNRHDDNSLDIRESSVFWALLSTFDLQRCRIVECHGILWSRKSRKSELGYLTRSTRRLSPHDWRRVYSSKVFTISKRSNRNGRVKEIWCWTNARTASGKVFPWPQAMSARRSLKLLTIDLHVLFEWEADFFDWTLICLLFKAYFWSLIESSRDFYKTCWFWTKFNCRFSKATCTWWRKTVFNVTF